MYNNFDREINNLVREVAAQKSQKPQSPSTLETYTTEITVNFDLELVVGQFYNYYVRSDKMALIDFGINTNPLVSVYFDVADTNGRDISDNPYYYTGTGNIGRMIFVANGNSADKTTLNNGGSVSVSYKLIITSTEQITPTVNYQDLWVV